MYVALARLEPAVTADQPTDADAQLVHDVLWAHATPADRLEHVRARAEAGGIDLTLFLGRAVGGQEQAKAQSEDLLRRARHATALSLYGIPGIYS
ncbi:hypothetical protein [Kitasatospora aureofaciens]|uniref:hypothetical protein n=1 Tax=Kitasatospora aureofaciens TaxID=1894 RepID=UPI0005264648|nr:hypothetical protein [Kitasatospora aureofaciens]HJD80910.1 hypothetical protein [Kitasatospora aureofaciens]